MGNVKGTLTPKKSKKHEQIVQAALTVFSQYGLSGASMDQIALAAEMSKSNIFYYFSGKEELYEHVLQYVLTEWLVPLEALTADRDPAEVLSEYIEAKLMLSKKLPEASRVYALEMIQGAPYMKAQLKGPLKKLIKEKLAIFDQWIAEGKMVAISPIHLLFSIWSLTQHYADFAPQVEALAGKTLSNKAFFTEVNLTLQHILLSGVLPRAEVATSISA